eukprot:UN17094
MEKIQVWTAGCYFGEIALLKNTTRTATIRTGTDVILLEFTREAFNHILDTAPEAKLDFQN